eukprot:scaffold39729_cov63-Phaeocystis_antarctica.AAC.11
MIPRTTGGTHTRPQVWGGGGAPATRQTAASVLAHPPLVIQQRQAWAALHDELAAHLLGAKGAVEVERAQRRAGDAQQRAEVRRRERAAAVQVEALQLGAAVGLQRVEQLGLREREAMQRGALEQDHLELGARRRRERRQCRQLQLQRGEGGARRQVERRKAHAAAAEGEGGEPHPAAQVELLQWQRTPAGSCRPPRRRSPRRRRRGRGGLGWCGSRWREVLCAEEAVVRRGS